MSDRSLWDIIDDSASNEDAELFDGGFVYGIGHSCASLHKVDDLLIIGIQDALHGTALLDLGGNDGAVGLCDLEEAAVRVHTLDGPSKGLSTGYRQNNFRIFPPLV